MMPLVLASNDANASGYDWKDITGVQYHYPNSYKNLIQPGTPFVYYRGVRRSDGSRGAAEYFGRGSIGAIWRDPDIPEEAIKAKWAWYCAIDDYEPFAPPVPAKINGSYLEEIKHENAWRNGVRPISDAVLAKILKRGSPSSPATRAESARTLPPINEVKFIQGSGLLKPRQSGGPSNSDGAPARYNRSAKLVGDRAEEIVVRWLGCGAFDAKEVKWVANEGDTPGWDIQFVSSSGTTILIEVKGTSDTNFSSFELTANELTAMRRYGPHYWLALVAHCLSTSPVIEIIEDPISKLDKLFSAQPIRWRCGAISSF